MFFGSLTFHNGSFKIHIIMRSTYTLADVFETPSRAPVLRAIALARRPMSVRAIARASNISHTAAGATLRDLESMGLATSATVGLAIVYELRRSNAYVRHMVLPAIEAEHAIVAELHADLVRLFAEDSESLILLGSYATGEQHGTSDIDLFALVRDERRKQQLEERARGHLDYIETTYGSPLSLLVYTRTEAREYLPAGKAPFRIELESTGIILHGLGTSEWGIDGTSETDKGGTKKLRLSTAQESR